MYICIFICSVEVTGVQFEPNDSKNDSLSVQDDLEIESMLDEESMPIKTVSDSTVNKVCKLHMSSYI